MPLGLEEQSQIVKAAQSLRVVFAQFGLTSARQHGRIAQIALRKRRNWKPTMAIKRIESQTQAIWFLSEPLLTLSPSKQSASSIMKSHQTEINALWSFQGLCHGLLWKPHELDFDLWQKHAKTSEK